jgi:hypothetical protein
MAILVVGGLLATAGCARVERRAPTDWLRVEARRSRMEMPHVSAPSLPSRVLRRVGGGWQAEDVGDARAGIVVASDAVLLVGEPVILLGASGSRRSLAPLGCTAQAVQVAADGRVVCPSPAVSDGEACRVRVVTLRPGDRRTHVVEGAWSPAALGCEAVEVRWLGTAGAGHVLWLGERRAGSRLAVLDGAGLRTVAEVDHEVGDATRWAAAVVRGFQPGRERFYF